MDENREQLIDMPPMGERIGLHSSCGGPCYRNRFGVEYCSWCGTTATLVPVSRLRLFKGGKSNA